MILGVGVVARDPLNDGRDTDVDANADDRDEEDVGVADGLVAGPILMVDRSTSPHASDPFA